MITSLNKIPFSPIQSTIGSGCSSSSAGSSPRCAHCVAPSCRKAKKKKKKKKKKMSSEDGTHINLNLMVVLRALGFTIRPSCRPPPQFLGKATFLVIHVLALTIDKGNCKVEIGLGRREFKYFFGSSSPCGGGEYGEGVGTPHQTETSPNPHRCRRFKQLPLSGLDVGGNNFVYRLPTR